VLPLFFLSPSYIPSFAYFFLFCFLKFRACVDSTRSRLCKKRKKKKEDVVSCMRKY
jgi:hypothetical protein